MKILNFGSMNLDHVYTVPHMVTPGETLLSGGKRLFCGGKGLNQSVAIAKAGGEIYHAGAVGEDGGILCDALTAAGVDTRYVQRRKGSSCETVIQVDPRGQNSIIVYDDPAMHMEEPDLDAILEGFGAGDILVLQNELYNSALMMRKAADLGLVVVFNPSPADEKIGGYPLERAGWLILNEVEGAALADGAQETDQILKTLRQKYPKVGIVLTLGSEGSVCCVGNRVLRQAAFPVKAVDTTAAGDTFTGYFVAGLARGEALPDILRRASLAASIAVTRPGAAGSIPAREEVEGALRQL